MNFPFHNCSMMVLLFLLLSGLFVPVKSGAATYDLGLIEPEVLAGEQAKWVVLDCRPKAKWSRSRILGAVSFSWEDYTKTDDRGVPIRVWPAQDLANALGQMGIDENTPVVAYGDADSSWGGEGWALWVMAWIGHKGPLRLLNGGIQAWQKADLPLEKDLTPQQRSSLSYRTSVRSELNISVAELDAREGQVTLIDTRSGWEWFRGHLPNAIHLPWQDSFAGEDNSPISPAAYRALLKEKQIPVNKPIVFYCTAGIRSGYAWLVHQLAGFTGGINFEGGTEAWDRRSGH